MQTDWLIDFMTLAQTRSFSRSAQLRNVTQPAFSRRIRALEAWASTELVDRACHPPSLTQAGRLLYTQAPSIVSGIQHTHSLLRAHTSIGQDVLRFAAPHTLASHFFSTWIGGMGASLEGISTRLSVVSPHESLQKLREGDCDLLLAYHGADLPLDFDPARCERLTLGQERLAPYASPDASGHMARHKLPGLVQHPVPYLAYSAGAGLGEAVELALKRQGGGLHLQRVFESDTCESLKSMALAGRGVAFLPESSVQAELANGRLLPAGEALEVALDICLLRDRRAPARASVGPRDVLWEKIKATVGAAKPDQPVQASASGGQHRHRELAESA